MRSASANAFVVNVIGDLHRVAVFGAGAGHEALADVEKEPTQAIAAFAADKPAQSAGGLATELIETGTRRGPHDQPLPNRYTAMANKDARDAALGINKGAKAGVGEGYVITQGSPMPGGVTVRAWLDALDNKLARAGAHGGRSGHVQAQVGVPLRRHRRRGGW